MRQGHMRGGNSDSAQALDVIAQALRMWLRKKSAERGRRVRSSGADTLPPPVPPARRFREEFCLERQTPSEFKHGGGALLIAAAEAFDADEEMEEAVQNLRALEDPVALEKITKSKAAIIRWHQLVRTLGRHHFAVVVTTHLWHDVSDFRRRRLHAGTAPLIWVCLRFPEVMGRYWEVDIGVFPGETVRSVQAYAMGLLARGKLTLAARAPKWTSACMRRVCVCVCVCVCMCVCVCVCVVCTCMCTF